MIATVQTLWTQIRSLNCDTGQRTEQRNALRARSYQRSMTKIRLIYEPVLI